MLTGDILRRSAARFPNKTAVIWEGEQLSYAALDARANQLANALLASGLKKGAKVGILSRNRLEYAVAFFGVARSGCVLVNVSVLYAPEELAFVLDKADVEVLLFEDIFAEKVAATRETAPKINTLIAVGGAVDNAEGFEPFIADAPATAPDVEIDERDPFCMTYTGGTTGRPKGVLASHRARAVTAHTVMVEEALDERDIVGIVTPMFHVAALNIMFQPAILAGATVTLLSQWSVEGFAAMVGATGMTANFMVPTQANMVIQDPAFDPATYASWRKMSFAGAPMPDWVQREFLKKLPDVKMTQIYGQSEMGVIAALRHWYLPAKLGAVGRAPYNVVTAVVRPDGTPVEPGEIGEVVSRGDNLMLEYYDEPEQTAGFFKHGDGWGWSGDLATIDHDGFITLVDRSKEMIISGGENVYPSEIERVLYDHNSVGECAVFGIPDPKWGEVPAAYVTLKTGAAVSEEELVEHCAQRLARFKRPRLVKFVDDFPKTPIGKIQKNLLKEPYWEEREKKI
ncbi:MAG: AMP-binding protein [Alphaproteobacteria bacterium]|nr:AMP-binding protein [Alphaproteobacteria bacterium]